METPKDLINQSRFYAEIAIAAVLADRGATSIKDLTEALTTPKAIVEAHVVDMVEHKLIGEHNGFYMLVNQLPERIN